MRRLLSNTPLALGLVLLAALVLLAIVGPFVVDGSLARVGAVIPRRPPSGDYWLGTDGQGRDMVTALILALPKTLQIGLLAGIISLCVGVVLGLASGFAGGWLDAVIRTLSDVMMTIPGIAIMVLVAANVREMTVALMAIIIAGLSWMIATRTIRAQTLSVRERGYVQIARLNGVSGLKLVAVEILPNLLPFIAASFVMTVSQAMLATIGLEALGLGPQSELTLGMIIYWAQFYSAIVRAMWWWWLPPIIMISLIFLGLMLTSIGLDSAVNKRLASQ
jgi:peptide/nickel transport system permease protein